MVVFSHPVMSSSSWPHGLQHVRPLCPSTSPEVCPSSYPLHWWCHPAISSSDALFSFCPQIFPSIRDFSNESAIRIRWPKNWSFSFSISPSDKYSRLISLKIDWFDDLAVKELLGVFSSNIFWRNQFFSTPPSLRSSSQNCMWPLGRP